MAIVDKEQWRREQEGRIQSKLPKPQSKSQLNGENLVRSIEDLIQQQRARRAKPIPDDGLDAVVGRSPFPEGRIPKDFNDPLV